MKFGAKLRPSRQIRPAWFSRPGHLTPRPSESASGRLFWSPGFCPYQSQASHWWVYFKCKPSCITLSEGRGRGDQAVWVAPCAAADLGGQPGPLAEPFPGGLAVSCFAPGAAPSPLAIPMTRLGTARCSRPTLPSTLAAGHLGCCALKRKLV